MNKKVLEAALHSPLIAKGFVKKGSTWYRKTEDLLQVVDLQKSSFGGQFYVNLCYVPEGVAVEGMPTPKEHKCPIRMRVTSLFRDDRARINKLFDLEDKTVSEEERTEGVRDLLSSSVLPFFDQTSSSTALRAAIEKGLFENGAVTLAARTSLGLAEARG